MKYYLAIDIGASSGRHIVGWMESGVLRTDEVYRFPNGVSTENGHLVWNTEKLLDGVRRGIAAAKEKYPRIESLSVDTWGVDYVLMKEDEEVFPVYAYRDGRTEAVIPDVHKIVPFSVLYSRTGCQFQPFNSVYQLYDDKCRGRLEGVTDFLMMPEYLMYKLTGVKAKEYTNATTTGLINGETGEFDRKIVKALGLPDELFPNLIKPGTPESVIGEYEGIKVVFCATHDTGSAVEGIGMTEDEPYISSGTWSLLGVRTPQPIMTADSMNANYSNEGGVGYNRYQKNIMGMWLIQELRRVMCPEKDYQTIEREAAASGYSRTIRANSQEFLSPENMAEAFRGALPGDPPATEADYFRCAYLSLAESYGEAVRELENNTGKTYKKIYIVGGGAKNAFLNGLTETATGKKVVALPIEATAIGNLMIQIRIGG